MASKESSVTKSRLNGKARAAGPSALLHCQRLIFATLHPDSHCRVTIGGTISRIGQTDATPVQSRYVARAEMPCIRGVSCVKRFAGAAGRVAN
jgi:hypothetical protein